VGWTKKLRERRIWERILIERLTEPLHLNLLSLPAAVGPFRMRVAFDLVLRQHHAWGLLHGRGARDRCAV
jgi:hypothetical protein